MPIEAVVDTNIWISGLISTSKTAAKVVDEWRRGKFKVVISEQQIVEIYKVLTRPKFSSKYGITEKEVRELVKNIKDKAERVTLKGDIELCRDPDDDMLLETAICGKAKYLITGDRDIIDDKRILSFLSQHDVSVISLSKFLNLISSCR
ncbi:MAG: putative toxin-antitoxin system toxin component, PIN family [Nitrospirae bacterium]|nr:putative toxin-antitoxin system toxin component, PIN family [Nitrospirota bacterium]